MSSDKIKELEEELEGCYRAIDDLERLNPKTDGVRIGHSVGTKKRKEIVIKSIEKKFKIFNARVSERASKS